VFEQLKKIPPSLTRCKTPPTSRRRSDYGINVGAIIAESVSSITGTNMSLTTGNLTRPHRHTGSCLVSREPPPQLSKSQRPGRASLTYPFARSTKLGQRRKILGPPSAPVMGEIKNDPSTHPQTLVCLARLSGECNDDDFDVLAGCCRGPHHEVAARVPEARPAGVVWSGLTPPPGRQ